jgi:hypothetical protein
MSCEIVISPLSVSRHCLSGICGAGLAMLLASARLLSAAEFNIRQVADDKSLNREPVLSETGLAAWYSLKSAFTNSSSDIIVHQNGETRCLSCDYTEFLASNIKPQVQSNKVVWTTTYTNYPDPTQFTLGITEVPNRDELKPGLDLDAHWKVVDGGSKWQEPDRQQFVGLTNEVVEGDTSTTNRAPSGRHPSGNAEIVSWSPEEGFKRITTDYRNDLAPAVGGRLVAWQKAKGWPFGWEIFAYNQIEQFQLTTNYYYDMAPKIHGDQIVWYGWDGHDFEIFLHDAKNGGTLQISSNQFDDVSPIIWDGVVAWEAYPAVEADIFMWKDGRITKLSDNTEDDFNPRLWNGQVVWQGFDGDDFEIYYFDGKKTVKLTSNLFDDVNPDIRDGLITWMGYHDNFDAEIYVYDGKTITRLTENDYEDRDPRTAGGRIVWQADDDDKSYIWLAEPK